MSFFTKFHARVLHFAYLTASASILLLCKTSNAAVPASPVTISAEFVGQFTLQSTTQRITGAPSEETAALLTSCHTGSDFHVIVSALPGDALVEIELGFAEISNVQAGQRVFDVDINDKRALSRFDIVATAGGPNRAILRRFTITPKRGMLDMHFTASVGEAGINYVRVKGRGFIKTVGVPVDAAMPSPSDDPDALPMNLPRYDSETAEVMQDEMTPTWPAGFPLGGIGTGKLEVLPNGEFANLTINNSWDLPVGKVPGTFIAIGSKASSGSGIGKVLRVHSAGSGGSGNYLNAKTFLSCVFRGIFPVAQWTFRDDKIPLEVILEGWSSLVPQNVADSSLPAAVFYVHLRNPRNYPISAAVAFSWEDINGRGGSRIKGDQFGYIGATVYSDAATSSVQGVLIRSNALVQGRRGTFTGDYFIGTPVKRAVVTRQLYWDPRAVDIPWWKSFLSRMRLEKIGPTPGSVNPAMSRMRGASSGPGAAVVCATVNLAPKEKRRIPFIVSWYVPNLTTIASASLPSTTEQQDYATTFGSSLGVASYVATNRIRLQSGTSEWQSMILRSNLPMWLKSHVLNSISPIVSNSILLQGQRFSMLESPGEIGGMMGALDHRLASQPFLNAMFPSLDRSELELYARAQLDNGHMPRYVGNIHGGWTGLDPKMLGQDWSDPTSAWLMQSAAHYRSTADNDFLEAIRPSIDRAVAYLEKSDTNMDGVPEAGSFFDDYSPGESSAAYKSGNFIGGFRALATLNDERATTRIIPVKTDRFRKLLSAYGSGESSSSTLATALTGDFCIRSLGLSGLVEDALLSNVLTAISSRHMRPFEPVLPIEVNADGSIVKGLGSLPGLLQASLGAEAISLGAVDLGMEVFARAQEVANRVQFSPWRQALSATVPEGLKPRLRSHMSSPAAWTALTSLSGAFLDVSGKTLYLDPKVPSFLAEHEMTLPVFTPAFWGWLDYNAETSTGTLAITKVLPGYQKLEIERVVQRRAFDGKPVNERMLLPHLVLQEDEVLRFEGWPLKTEGKLLVQNPDLAIAEPETTSTLSEDVESTAGLLVKDTMTSDTATSGTRYGP